MADYAFNESEPDDVWFTVDTIPPKISINDTTNNGFTNQPAHTISGQIEELHLATLSINGQTVDVDANNNYAYSVTLVEGENTFVIHATDLAGNHSEIIHTVILDTIPPVITVNPAEDTTTNQSEITLSGNINEPATLTLNGHPLTLNKSIAFTTTRRLDEGGNRFGFKAIDRAGNQTYLYRTITKDTTPPPAPNPGRISVSEPDENGVVTITGQAGSVAPNSWVIVSVGGDGNLTIAPGEPTANIINCDANTWRVQADQYGGFVLNITPGGLCPIIIVTEDPGGNRSDPTTYDQQDPPVTREGIVGALPGEFSVDASGAANYKIPIEVPPGVGGVQPQLAFLYSSRASNGQLGVGWSLSGLSAITRCPQTMATDGKDLGITLSKTDRLCLDGQRLVTDAAGYMQSGNTYYTEIASFQKVTSHGGSFEGGPAGFIVVDKAGLIRYYGKTTAGDSRFLIPGTQTALSWPIQRIEDRFGNYIEFTYGETTANGTKIGEYWPETIRWYNANDTLIGQVKFGYGDNRTDTRTSFMYSGVMSSLTKRLTRVHIYSKDEKVYTYKLSYQYGSKNKRSQLRTIQQCNADKQCLPPTTFDWQQGDVAFEGGRYGDQEFYLVDESTVFNGDVDGDGSMDLIYADGERIYARDSNGLISSTLQLASGANFEYSVTLDYNADGLTDIMIPTDFGGRDVTYRIYVSNGQGFESEPVDGFKHGSSLDPENMVPVPVDLDGDALPEIVTRLGFFGELNIYWRKENGRFRDEPEATDYQLKRQQHIFPVEFNGDGQIDLLVTMEGCDAASVLETEPGGGGGGGGGGGNDDDDNGNDGGGTFELINCHETAGILVNIGGDLVNNWAEDRCTASIMKEWPPRWPFPFPNPVPEDPCAGQFGDQITIEKPIPLDANGDGLTDIFYPTDVGANFRLMINTGGWFTTTWYGHGIDDEGEDAIRVMDYNADGMQDILIPQNGTWRVLVSKGQTFAAIRSTGMATSDEKRSRIVDVTADGLPDLLFRQGNPYGHGWYYYNQTGPKSGLITTITNGFGHRTVVDYLPLTHSTSTLTDEGRITTGVYEGHTDAGIKNNNLSAPRVRNILAPLYVVSQFGVDSGAQTGASMLYTRYHYKGAKLNQWGRGFLGFYQVRATNYNTNTETINRHWQDFPYTGMVQKSERRTPDRVVTSYEDTDIVVCPQTASGLVGPGTPGALPDGCVIDLPPPPEVIPGDIISKSINTFALFEWDERYYPYVKSSISTHYDLHDADEVLKQIETTYTYDSNGQGGTWGNPTRITVVTDNGSNAQKHITRTVNSYTNNAADWCLGRLTRATVTKTLPNGQSDSRVSAFSYAQTSGTAGLKTCQLKSETVEPGTAYELTKTYGFDTFGNRTSVTVSGAGITSRTTYTDYTDNGLYPETITNALGHSETQTWDARFGVKTKVVGPNGLPTTWTYDNFGRKIAIQAPRAAVSSEWEYTWCNQQACISEDAVWQLTQTGSDGSLVITAYDKLGRKVMSATQDYQGRLIQQATFYDIKGRPYLTSQPYFATEQKNACWAYRQYDNLDRVIKSYAPASEAQCENVRILDASTGEPLVTADKPPTYGAVTTFVYNDLLTYSRDPQGRTVSRRENVMGRLMLVAERGKTAGISQTNLPGIYQHNGVPVTTRYSYTPYGNTKTVTDAAGNITTLTYNPRGFKVAMNDPDMGSWTYHYNVLGELISQTDAKGQTVTMVYDNLGRLIQRTEVEGTTTWRYDSAAGKGIGKLHSVAFTPTGRTTPDFVKAHTYNQYGELTDTVQIMDGHAYWISQAYDNFGRPQTLTYPATTASAVTLTTGTDGTINGIPVSRDTGKDAFTVRYHYTRSTLTAVVNPKTQLQYWHLGQSDAAGRITKSRLGNNLTSRYQYDRARGVLLGLNTGQGSSANIQNLDYQWDQVGNLTRRENHIQGVIETFGYDTLYRLNRVERAFTKALPVNPTGGSGVVPPPTGNGCDNRLTICLAYDAIGNIIHKGQTYTGYQYGKSGSPNVRPHAVNAVTVQTDAGTVTRHYEYDINGNLIEGGGNTLTWASYNKPVSITETATGYSSQFAYGPSRARYWQQAVTEKGTTTTWYVGGNYERITDNTGTQHRYFVRAGGQVIAVHKEQSSTSTSPSPLRGEGQGERSLTNAAADLNADGRWIEYLHRNHQGSIVAVTNSAGDLLARYSYDAWGKRRSPVSWGTDPLSQIIPDPFTTRGYTGHEHLDHLGLIHMNGRAYAPEIGRFLSADPFTQFPKSTQGLNRYSYVGNNPMSYTDPSGHFVVAAIAAAVIATTQYVTVAVIVGAIAGYLTTGTLKGAILGAASAAVGFGIANAGLEFAAATLAHGISQGVIAELGGGQFAIGFKAALVGSILHKVPLPDGPMGTVIAAMLGGTISDINGGRFANGALTAAFVYAAGNIGKSVKTSRDRRPDIPANLSEKQRAALDKALAAVNEELNANQHTFTSQEKAAKFLHDNLGPLSRKYDVEIGAHIYKGSVPNTVVVFRVETQYLTNRVYISVDSDWKILASFHTHGTSMLFNDFSEQDIGNISYDAYLSAPNGYLYRFDYASFTNSGLTDTFANRKKYVEMVQ